MTVIDVNIDVMIDVMIDVIIDVMNVVGMESVVGNAIGKGCYGYELFYTNYIID
ncbi:MAG TPA: hypothetical protein GXZ21_12050 [Clostridiales bacterium]|nr:hypothetical protein [Clostridiales bacterium]